MPAPAASESALSTKQCHAITQNTVKSSQRQYVTAGLIMEAELISTTTQDKAKAMIQGQFTSLWAPSAPSWLPASWQLTPSWQVQSQ